MKQWEKLLKLLRLKPLSTMEIVREFIPAPQKVIQTLRRKGYNIETKAIDGKKHCIYVLHEYSEQLGLLDEAQ